MKKPNIQAAILLTSFFLIIYSGISAQDMNIIDLGGSWKFRKQNTTKWMDARVPGVVHLDLMKNNVITEPFFRDNEKYQQWISDIGWEYEKKFYIPDTLFIRRNIELVCKGLDTYANVYLNDSLIIVADNMFRTWYATIKPILQPGFNTLRIQFPSPTEINKLKYNELGYKLPGDEKVVCRKAAYHFGWDWGPTFITSGIWKPIYIRYWDYVNVLDVHYIQNSLSDTVARMNAEFTVTSTLADSALFRILLNGNELARKWEVLFKGSNIVNVEFEIKDPQRWWPNGMGDQYLYQVGHEVYFAKRLFGKGTTRIGLRTVELVQDKDSIGRSFYFRVNGIPVFMKGANYIPQDNFIPRVADTSYRDIIRNAAADNMNMLRVWGGGIYENDIFYDYCDEYGILVWQDFMFANAMYPGTKQFKKNVETEVMQNVIRLRNHPCIALWCGNNEIEEGWQNWGWARQYNYSVKDSLEIYGNFRNIFMITIKDLVNKSDPGTPYIPSSPRFGWGKTKSYTEGDSHYWGVWHGKEPFASYTRKIGRFVSEYGFQAFPNIVSIYKFAQLGDRKIDSPVMKEHQKSPIGFERIEEYLVEHYKKPKDLESYVHVSQLLQAEGIKTAIEAHRRAKPVCMGSLYWQLNDCWPAISWSSQDYYGRKKALGYWVRNEFAATLVSPVVNDGKVNVYVITDELKALQTELLLELIDFSGNILWRKTIPAEIPANSSILVFDTAYPAFTRQINITKTLLIATLKKDGEVISQNTLYFTPPKDLELEMPAIQGRYTQIDEGYRVELSTDKLAKNVCLRMPFRGELPENYFDLIPGRPKTMIYKTKTKFPDISKMVKITSLIDTY